MAGNKILPFGTAYSAMCPMIYDSININWWWWSRITQTSGSSVELFSYLPHLPPRQTSAQKCRLFLPHSKLVPYGKHLQPRARSETRKRSFLSGKHFVNCKASLSFFFTLALTIYCDVCVYTSLSAVFCVFWCSWKEIRGTEYAADSVWDRGNTGHMN